MSTHYPTLVVGGGLNGLAAAWHLARLGGGGGRVAVVERFRLGHARGSSHGESRITRSGYAELRYVRLAQRARAEDWPRLERSAGAALVHPCPGAIWGEGEELPRYARAAEAAGAEVERVPVPEARRLFPALRFAGSPFVLVDRTAGVVAAAETMRALARLVSESSDVLEETRVLDVDGTGDPVRVETDRGALTADRVVVAAGPWTARLVPRLASRLTVRRQTVAWFAPPAVGAAADFEAPRFPVWMRLGESPDDVWYGLPPFGRPGLKAARHDTGGAEDDPEADPDPRRAAAAAEAVRERLQAELLGEPGALLGTETCLYTMAPDHDLVVGPLEDDPRIVVGSACSGHGFKFGPLVGRMLAELALHGRTTVPEYEPERARFGP